MLNAKVRNNEDCTVSASGGEAPDVRVVARGTGLCRPFRAVISWRCLPGVSPRATPWLPSGITPGCALTKMSEIPESKLGFVLHDADGEWLMRRDCPEFSSRVGGVRAGIRGQMAEVRGQCENSGRCAPVRRCVDADVRIRNKTRV